MNQLTPTSPDQLQTFQLGQLTLRALLLAGEPWFVAADVARALGYRDAYNLARRLDEDEKGTHSVSTLGGQQDMSVISESGLYSAILTSQVEGAKEFKRWVTAEVLPAIRKTGTYQTPQTLEERSLSIITELTGVVAEQKALIAEIEPKAEVYNRVLTPEHSFGFRQLVSALREHFPVNEADIKRVLRERGLIHQQTLTATAKAIDGGWAVQRAQGNWGGKERFQARFTTKTLEWLLKELEPLEDVA